MYLFFNLKYYPDILISETTYIFISVVLNNNNIIPYIILINILDFSYLPTRGSKTKVYTNKPKIRNTHEITLKIRIEFIDQC